MKANASFCDRVLIGVALTVTLTAAGCVDGSLANRDDGSDAVLEQRRSAAALNHSALQQAQTDRYKSHGASDAAAAATAAADDRLWTATGHQ